MCCQDLSHSLIKITVVLLFLVGCSAPAATPIPATETPPPTPVPSTAIPAPEITPPENTPPENTPAENTPPPTPSILHPSAEMLIGNWQPLSISDDATFLQINSNGTCRQSYSLDGLTNIPEIECTYIYDGSNFSLTAVKLNGVPECPSPTGVYEIRLMADDQIQLVPKKDSCTPRIRSTRGEYQRIP